ncbi:MAG: nitrilase-related carbon-nitrogen hydrolase [Candidatus Hodarchaeota archaeon]
MQTEKEEELLKKAELEEKAYNWAEAARLYEQAAKSFLDKNKMEKAAEAYKMLGCAYSRASDTVESAKEYLELKNYAVKAYKEAVIIYKQIKNRPEELECEAETSFNSGFIMGTLEEQKKELDMSCKLFIESSDLYFKEDNQKSIARTLSRASLASVYLALNSSDLSEIKEYIQKGTEINEKTWKISKDIENIQTLVESLYAETVLIFIKTWIVDFRGNEPLKELLKKYRFRIDESLKLTKEYDDSRVKGLMYFINGMNYCTWGVYVVEEETEQRKYMDKGLRSIENSLVFLKKTKDKSLIILSTYWISLLSVIGARFEYLQSRIFNYLLDIMELGKIYEDSNTIWRFYAKFSPAMYYSYFAQKSFLTPIQRKSYAEKGIEHANEVLNKFFFLPLAIWPYQMLTWSHSLLATFATVKDERDEHTQKMLQYARQAEKIAKKFEGMFPRAFSYSSLYRAYKTLSDIAENKEDKIKMLSNAIDAHKKYVEYAVESMAGIIVARMRLGLLYEELGIISMEIEPLDKAKELFQHVIKESFERRYYFHLAAAHEYFARIENRLGNHIAAAEYYEKAREAHIESLKTIDYKLLKERVKEKIEYAYAWIHIERAKAFHNSENHTKAKECYEKAYNILKNLPSYNYEAPYYSAWISQEEAEQFSKQEKHEKAIESFEKTRKIFENAIKTLKKSSKKSKEKIEKERINKLEKIAKVRMNHCSARVNLEEARILGMKGDHIAAAEKFALAASQFRDICTLFKIKRDRGELESVYYLCRAWESMELAEKYEDPDRFSEAANLFAKASKFFTDSKMKLLASGNSAFCQALELGSKFDKSPKTKIKSQLYPKIKSMLRNAAASYRKGGFEGGAEWALATSTYFDAMWHLVRVDEELDHDKKKELLGIGSRYLKSAAELFGNNNYKDKEREILERLDMVEKEEKILISALNTIRKPSISGSTIGIVAPACPLETSLSPRIGEVRQFTEEATRVIDKRMAKKKYEIIYRDLLKVCPRVQKRECRIGISQIRREFYKMKPSGLLGLRENKVELLRSKIKKMIESAHENGVNILLFPETTIDLNYGEILKDLLDFAKLYEMYIIPGSYHDQETRRNICVVIGPDGVLWEQEKHIPAIIHLGKKRFKEAIEVGILPRKTVVCNTEYGRIAIAICRDFLDMDLRVELKNFEPPVDILLNPAFTPVTADFKAAHFDARRSTYAYCFFANVGEFGDSLIYTPEKERVERTIPPKKEGLIYKDVDLFKLRSERKKWEKEQKKEMQFIQSTR